MTSKSPGAKKIESERVGKSKTADRSNGLSGRSLSQRDVRRAEKRSTSANDLTLRAWEKTYANRSARKACS